VTSRDKDQKVETAFTLEQGDGARLAAYRWEPAGTVHGILVVAHGMGEHARRYPPALAALIDDGLVTYGVDHRGHGATIAMSAFAPGDYGAGGFAAVVEDLAALIAVARKEYPELPLILLGHSMGSFIAQSYVMDHGHDIDGLILVGTTALDRLAEGVLREPDVGAALNRRFEPARTPFDWISSDDTEVDKYLSDPLCGFALTPASMMDMLSQGPALAHRESLDRIPKTLPILVVVGEADPLGTHLGSVPLLVDRYRQVGLRVELLSYSGRRHEILNETNRHEVVGDIAGWLSDVMARGTGHPARHNG
jgi:alpha-beta hydrolase superfamily lysophospholipase